MKNKLSELDTMVEEVRAIRRKLWKEAGGTPERYLRFIETRASERAAPDASKGGGGTVPGSRVSRRRPAG